jgi:hypothetical protein
MDTAISGGAIGSDTTCMQVAVLLGLMLKSVCENTEFHIFSSPNETRKCHVEAEIPNEKILENL